MGVGASMTNEERWRRLVERNPALAELALAFLERVERIGEGQEPGSFGQWEDSMESDVDELFRGGVKDVLERKAIPGPEVMVEGQIYRILSQPARGTYFTRRGVVDVERPLYRAVDRRNGPTIVPFELELGFVEGSWTPRAARAASHLLQAQTAREAAALVEDLHVMPYSRSSFLRLAEVMGSRWEEIHDEVEPKLRVNFEVPEEARSISVSIDRVAVPMDETGQENGVAYRMAWAGVWTLHDADGEPIHSVRYGRMPEDGADPLIASLRADIAAIGAQRPLLPIAALTDGGHDVRAALEQVVSDVAPERLYHALDYYHVAENLAKATKELALGAKEASEWRHLVRDDPNGPSLVAAKMRAAHMANPEATKATAEVCAYMERNDDRMPYAELRAAKMPIGSGHVEATCKTLVSVRMRRAGSRWSTRGGQAILNLRSLAQSHRWGPAMDHVEASFRRQVTAIVHA